TAVMTGSTNWTSFGLCAQTNNSIILENPEIAAAYLRYWQRLNEDVIDDPNPRSAPGGSNVQGRDLRHGNQHPESPALGAGEASLWYSPNTIRTTRDIKHPPPDLEELFSLIDGAKKAVFFLAFLPSRGGLFSIIEQSRKAGETNPNLLVVGVISDPTAMP